jgi:DNA processing protein
MEASRPCDACRRRSALIAALAPAISRLKFTREGLIGLLSLPEEQLIDVVKLKDPDEFLRRLEIPLPTKRVATVLCRHNLDYPQALAQLDSAPAVLYATCTIECLRELLTRPTVAIVGGREHSAYAHQITLALAHDLAAAGVTIISNINQGLEGTAHDSALAAQGHTIAVMPGAPQTPYSRHHKDLHRQILARGAAVSEFPPGFFPIQRWCFISSQRILAALARLVVIVEAQGKVSALLVAHIAGEVGHDVAVVPGRVTDPGGLRTFGLLRDGAHPVSCAQDVLGLLYGAGVRTVA